MKSVLFKIFASILIATLSDASTPYTFLETTNGRPAFDYDLYEQVLDPELCQQQLKLARSKTLLLLQFLESGMRIPRSIQMGNLIDMGNYYQCLGIDENVDDTKVEGKYCTIEVPLNQFNLPQFPSLPDWLPDDLPLPDWLPNPKKKIRSAASESVLSRLINVQTQKKKIRSIARFEDYYEEDFDNHEDDGPNFSLAICVPKACTIKEGLEGLLFNLTRIGFRYKDFGCRLPNDKPWVPVDYITICIFSVIGLLTILSTSYDVYKTKVLKSDPKTISTFYRSFSVYTNAHRLTSFTKGPGTLDCIDGIRVLAMVWVIVGHAFFVQPPIMNPLDAYEWTFSFSSFWITTAPITVDTFFMLSGLLVVYSTANKFTGLKLLRNLHLFLLSRPLRMFPLLAAAILVQASILLKISDGPRYEIVAFETETCRRNWWTTLLYIQNFVDPLDRCIPLTWYLAIDMQLHYLTPIVLFFVVGRRKKVAWTSLILSLVATLTASTVYIFSLKGLQGAQVPGHWVETDYDYFLDYYINTLARASPFLVGMVFGYILHLHRENKMIMSKPTAVILWIHALFLTSVCIFITEPMKSWDWNFPIINSLVNSFQRPGWALGLGWIILACDQGYGGPINWFLSLQMWKLPARVSYAMYLFHMMIQEVIAGTYLAPIYFTPFGTVYNFLAQLLISFIVGFFATLLIDSPFSILFKYILGGGRKRASPKKEEIEQNQNMDIQK